MQILIKPADMPKRPNPFADLCAPQLKTHVGEKEVNMGANWENNMKVVYERTQDLLSQGAKRQFCETNYRLNHKISKSSSWLPQMKKEKSSGNYMQNNLNNVLGKSFSSADIQSREQCLFCECPVSLKNLRTCELCKGEFCHLCSTLRYDQHEETAICLSCL